MNAFDGDKNTVFHTETQMLSPNHWLLIELEQTTPIIAFRLMTRPASPINLPQRYTNIEVRLLNLQIYFNYEGTYIY